MARCWRISSANGAKSWEMYGVLPIYLNKNSIQIYKSDRIRISIMSSSPFTSIDLGVLVVEYLEIDLAVGVSRLAKREYANKLL